MTTCRKAMMLYLAALLALGGLAMGCGDDDDGGPADAGFDAGPPDEDAGFDAGECVPDCTDKECGDDGCGGTCGDLEGMCPGGLDCDEGSCPTTVFTRLAHLMPNAGGIRICAYVTGLPDPFGPLPDASSYPNGIPPRGVSGYVSLFSADPIEYDVRFYNEADVADGCPAVDAATPEALLAETIDGSTLTPGSFYTIAAVGFADEGGSAPSRCGATLMEPCADAQLAHLEVYDDEVTIEDDTMTKFRFLHAVPNLGPLDVCFDDDLSDDAAGTELFADVAYPAVADYIETDPRTETSPPGGFTLHINLPGVTTECPDETVDVGGIPIATKIATIRLPWPYPDVTGDGIPDVPEGAATEFPAGQVATLFASGDASKREPTDPDQVAVVPFLDVAP